MQSLQILDLNTVIGGITEMLPRLIGEDIELVFAPAQDLGKVKADPIQIEQILMNLAANARDAMPGGGRLNIETAMVRVDESYVQRHAIVPPGIMSCSRSPTRAKALLRNTWGIFLSPFTPRKKLEKEPGWGWRRCMAS